MVMPLSSEEGQERLLCSRIDVGFHIQSVVVSLRFSVSLFDVGSDFHVRRSDGAPAGAPVANERDAGFIDTAPRRRRFR